jgi:D-cysteine desulfhydrase
VTDILLLENNMRLPDHFDFSMKPTPIMGFKRYFKKGHGYKLWIKRDDLTGLELSGNKVRKLDFLLKDAQKSSCRQIITCGGLQSNHCRTTAFCAAQLGMKTTLVLRGEKPSMPEGNYFLNSLLNANIRFVSPDEYNNVESIMQQTARQTSGSVYIIPEGGSNETGAWGYINCFLDILEQSKKMNQKFDTIVFATGSGGTHAGLLLGKLLTSSDINIVSVNVCNDAAFFVNKIDWIIKRFIERYGYNLNWNKNEIKIVDGFVGGGYGVIAQREADAISRFAQSEGLIIDPVYGVKALLALEEELQNKTLPGKNILFIHTGGIFGLFPYWLYFN